MDTELGNLALVTQVTRKYVRFCKKQSCDVAGIQEGLWQFLGVMGRGIEPQWKEPMEGEAGVRLRGEVRLP